MVVIKAIITSVLSMLVLFFLTKLTGDKQISQMSMFDYITGITIGSAGAEMAIGGEAFIPALVATVLYGVAAFLISFICNKSIKLRKFLNGEPMVLYLNGVFNRKNMARVRMDIGEFLTQCRNSGYFSLDEITCAIMEANGKVSFLKSDSAKKVDNPLGTEVIIDGTILKKNLELSGKNTWWLISELDRRGIKLKQVMFATIENETLSVYPFLR